MAPPPHPKALFAQSVPAPVDGPVLSIMTSKQLVHIYLGTNYCTSGNCLTGLGANITVGIGESTAQKIDFRQVYVNNKMNDRSCILRLSCKQSSHQIRAKQNDSLHLSSFT